MWNVHTWLRAIFTHYIAQLHSHISVSHEWVVSTHCPHHRTITVMSHERLLVLNHRQLYCSSTLQTNNKENFKVPHYWLFERGSLTKCQQYGKYFHGLTSSWYNMPSLADNAATYCQTSNIGSTTSQNVSGLVFAQSIEARCSVDNEDVIGAVPTGTVQ